MRRLLSLALSVLLGASACAAPETSETSPSPTPPPAKVAVSQGLVTKVTDGDTIHVQPASGEKVVIRIIGINTPETVAPNTGVQCYGPESSAEAKRLLTDQPVILVFDPSQGSLDKYGRTLAYVQVEGLPDSDYGLHMIREGFAKEYTYSRKYARQKVYREAQIAAQSERDGLWSAC